MTRNRLCQLLALTLLLAVALPAIAASKNKDAATGNVVAKGTFNLYYTKSLNGTTLQPGEYKVVASDSQVSFLHNGKIVAQAPIQWKDAEVTSDNAIVDENGSIREITFKGKKQSVTVM